MISLLRPADARDHLPLTPRPSMPIAPSVRAEAPLASRIWSPAPTARQRASCRWPKVADERARPACACAPLARARARRLEFRRLGCSCASSQVQVDVRLPAPCKFGKRTVLPDQRKVVLATFPCRIALRDQRASRSHPPFLHQPDSNCISYQRACVHKILHETRLFPRFSQEQGIAHSNQST
jgi:hypothetical protein